MTAAPKPEECALLVAISFHYVQRRAPYLIDVVRALADFRVRRLDIRVMINDVPEAAALQSVLAGVLPTTATVAVTRCGDLAHPFELTWAHKPLIADEFLAGASPYTHFVYLEDDMRFGPMNFRYFLEYRAPLAHSGLIPSFVRVEYGNEILEMRSTDHVRRLPYWRLRKIPLGPHVFVSPPNPYCALFVLDRPLAEEYVATNSFDLARSQAVRGWPTRERSAMGLCWENVPRGFRSRFAIPIDLSRGTAAAEAWVPHLPNNYIPRIRSGFGQVPMLDLLEMVEPDAPIEASPSAAPVG